MLLVQDSQTKRGSRLPAILGSIGFHATLFTWLLAPSFPDRQPSAYKQLIKPHEEHLVWYNFKRELPQVQPRTNRAENRPLKAEVKLEKQSIVSAPVNAPKAPQMIFHPVPELKIQPPQPLPNLIALSAPPPPRKEFVPPRPVENRKPARQAAEIVPAPELKAEFKTPQPFELPQVHRPFAAPRETKRQLTAQIHTAEAPQLQSDAQAVNASSERAIDLATRTLAIRPTAPRSITASVGNMPDAPMVEGAGASQANVAVVGLNPIDNLNVAIPEGSRKAQFSGGPKINPNGATSAGVGSGITVPDLTVRGGDKKAETTLLARSLSNSPTSPEALREIMRGARTEPAPESRGLSGTRVSGSPDPRFQGRQVFSVAIQSPNLTSHIGSWLMWYADRGLMVAGGDISAPQPMHKVDPRYVPGAVEEHVEGTVRLAFVIGRDGKVYGIEMLKGIDTRLDQSAAEALRKWQFEPATRGGKPIDVDAVVDIPFRLAPLTTR